MKYLRAHNMGALLIGLCLLINLIPFVSNTDEYENLALGKAHTFAFSTDDKVKIIANVNYPNNDGIHINCSRNVTISNCSITCGDDCIVVRANSSSLREDKVCERVVVDHSQKSGQRNEKNR